jgi:hypothetical protein
MYRILDSTIKTSQTKPNKKAAKNRLFASRHSIALSILLKQFHDGEVTSRVGNRRHETVSKMGNVIATHDRLRCEERGLFVVHYINGREGGL